MSDKLIDRRKKPIFLHSKIDTLPLTLEAFRVYAHLARCADNDKGLAFPSYSTIADTCFRASYPTAHTDTLKRKAVNAIRELESWRLVTVERKQQRADGGWTSNLYTLTDESEWAKDAEICTCNVRQGVSGNTTPPSDPEIPSPSDPEIPSPSDPEIPSPSDPEIPSPSDPEIPRSKDIHIEGSPIIKEESLSNSLLDSLPERERELFFKYIQDNWHEPIKSMIAFLTNKPGYLQEWWAKFVSSSAGRAAKQEATTTQYDWETDPRTPEWAEACYTRGRQWIHEVEAEREIRNSFFWWWKRGGWKILEAK